jgi:predicted RNA-binding protein YlqC (UPF0109 family)
MDEIIRGWRKLHNEELPNLYISTSVIRMIIVNEDEMGRVCGTKGREEECIRKTRTRETTRKIYT